MMTRSKARLSLLTVMACGALTACGAAQQSAPPPAIVADEEPIGPELMEFAPRARDF